MGGFGALTLQTLQYLKVQSLHNLFLRFAGFHIVVKPRRGIDFKHPIFLRLFRNTAPYHQIHAAEAQSHVARQIDGEPLEFRVYDGCHIYGIAAGGKIGVVLEKHVFAGAGD